MRIDIAAVRARLRARRDELEQLGDAGKAARQPVELDQASVGRLSRMDAMRAQAMAVEAQRRRELELRRIDAALQRIAAGEYGYCVQCGDEIGAKRLELDPTVATCIACASGGPDARR